MRKMFIISLSVYIFIIIYIIIIYRHAIDE